MALEDPRKQRLLDWLCSTPDEREPKKLSDLAEELGYTVGTLNNWKKDLAFLEEWQSQYLLTIGNPGVKQEIMQTLLRTATDSEDPHHVRAAEAYFKIEGSLKPQVDVNVTRGDLGKASVEELEEMAALIANDELSRRRDAS